MRGRQPFRGGGGRDSRLQVDSLVEEFVANQDHRGEKTQLKVAKKQKAQINFSHEFNLLVQNM